MKLSSKLVKDAFIFLVAISIPAYFFAFNYTLNKSKKEREQTIVKHVLSFKVALTDALWNGDYPYAKQILNALSYNDGVTEVSLADENMKVVFDMASNGGHALVSSPVFKNKKEQYLKDLSYKTDELKIISDDESISKYLLFSLAK